MYNEAGWQGYKEFTVIQKTKESKDITSFYIKPVTALRFLDLKRDNISALKCGLRILHIRTFASTACLMLLKGHISFCEKGQEQVLLISTMKFKGDKLEVSAPPRISSCLLRKTGCSYQCRLRNHADDEHAENSRQQPERSVTLFMPPRKTEVRRVPQRRLNKLRRIIEY